MFRHCMVLGFMLAASWSTLPQSDNYWLIREVTGRWEYRLGADIRALTGEYEAVVPDGQVRCRESDLQSCELRYLVNERTQATARLEIKLLAKDEWVSLKRLKPPPPPLLPANPSKLAEKFMRITRPGGSRSSGCGGNLPLKAPACGEYIDIAQFKILWPTGGTGKLSIIVENADGVIERHRAAASLSDPGYQSEETSAFLRRLQRSTEVVDVTITILAAGDRMAVRLVHLPPSIRSNAYDARVKAVAANQSVKATATLIALANEERMWSRAAEHATALIQKVGRSSPVLDYAAVGLCQSDFVEEKAVLQKHMGPARYKAICTPTSGVVPPAVAPAVPAAVPDHISTAQAGSAHRIGLALLIGNSVYWDTPLNSVKSDLKEMSKTLSSLGFSVTTRENLKGPQQFAEALEEVLRTENPSPEDVLFVYYSGHGVQLDGKAHLLGTGISPSARIAEDLRSNAQSAQDLLARMERAIPGTRVLVIEACRDNVLSSDSMSSPAARGGFAFQQDDVPNTFVMFANKPGETTPVRSESGLMGPFTQAFIHALDNSTGEINAVFEEAKAKTIEISPSQEPVLYRSKSIESVRLRRGDPNVNDDRAVELLNKAENLYSARSWEDFVQVVERGGTVAQDPALRQRLTSETEFARIVMAAEAAEEQRVWTKAAESWNQARTLFPRRDWVALKAGVAWLLADDVAQAVNALATLAAESDSEVARQAAGIVLDLTKSIPALEVAVRQITEKTAKVPPQPEFAKVQKRE